MDPVTIAAIATPGGRGGIGIIKLSGPEAGRIAADIFRVPEPPTAGCRRREVSRRFESHRFNYGFIFDPDHRRWLDEVLLVYMAAPRTYTREDVVEIHAHGGPVVLRSILELVLRCGARLAEPGEFTRRAFVNGRIDLTQAEAVCDLIQAQTDSLLHAAAGQVQGGLRSEVAAIRQQLIDLQAHVEAAIDFPEEVHESLDTSHWADVLQNNIMDPLGRLIRFHQEAGMIRDGLKLAIVGRPNVGKSSLLNRLLKRERVIVTSVPGTTRDVVEEVFSIQGVPIRIADTAGLHETNDPIERIGIDKTFDHVAGCDGVLFMVEAHQPVGETDNLIYKKIRRKPLIVTVNKIDLVHADPLDGIPEHWRKHPQAPISALNGDGIEELKDRIVDICRAGDAVDVQTDIIPNVRHRALLDRSLQAAEAIRKGINDGIPLELVAIHLQESVNDLGKILGIDAKVDVLENIFSRFCVGK